VRYLTLLAPAQDFIEILAGIEQTVEIFVASRELGMITPRSAARMHHGAPGETRCMMNAFGFSPSSCRCAAAVFGSGGLLQDGFSSGGSRPFRAGIDDPSMPPEPVEQWRLLA
jgi:hypothetical protein